MRLFSFSRGGDEDDAARKRREESEQGLQQGRLPLNAVDRLREQASRQGTPSHIFTSDLSVNELALVHEAGYEPLGQVMGCCVYHVGWQFLPGWSMGSGELTVLTEAYYTARHRAIDRLRQEAALLGATGVVGVRLERTESAWGADLVEFKAIGTAIREQGVATTGRALPFVSNLSGSEFWLLRQSGFRPVGLAIGNCSYFQVPTWNTQSVMSSGVFGWNQEMADYTQAVYNSRSLAMYRMEEEARVEGGIGVLGADVTVTVQPYETGTESSRRVNMMLHFTAVGTAVAVKEGRWPLFSVKTIVPMT